MQHFSFLKKTAALLLGIGVMVTASYALATGVWHPAPGKAPANNSDTLVDTGTANQVKQGDLSVGANTTGVFSAYENASFAGPVTLNGMVRGGTPNTTNSAVLIGGTDPVSSVLHTVATAITGGIATTSTVQTDTLKQSNAAAPVCADTTGTLVICNSVASTTNGGTNTATLYRHYPPVYIQMIGESVPYEGPTTAYTVDANGNSLAPMGPGIKVAISDNNPTLDNVEVLVHVTRDDAATNTVRRKDTCPWAVPAAGVDEDYVIFAGSTSSNETSFPPDCFGHLNATITTITPTTIRDGRSVLPLGGNLSI